MPLCLVPCHISTSIASRTNQGEVTPQILKVPSKIPLESPFGSFARACLVPPAPPRCERRCMVGDLAHPARPPSRGRPAHPQGASTLHPTGATPPSFTLYIQKTPFYRAVTISTGSLTLLFVARTSSRHLVLVKTQTGTVYTHQEFKTRSLTPIPFCFGCL